MTDAACAVDDRRGVAVGQRALHVAYSRKNRRGFSEIPFTRTS